MLIDDRILHYKIIYTMFFFKGKKLKTSQWDLDTILFFFFSPSGIGDFVLAVFSNIAMVSKLLGKPYYLDVTIPMVGVDHKIIGWKLNYL